MIFTYKRQVEGLFLVVVWQMISSWTSIRHLLSFSAEQSPEHLTNKR